MALNIEEGQKSREEVDLDPEDSFRAHVRNLCGLFMSIINSKIYLIHQTTKEFLVSEGATFQAPSYVDSCLGVWKHSLEPSESNLVLSKICISHTSCLQYLKAIL